jgi:hypothetical protein
MPTGTYEYRTPEERRAIEAAIAFVAEMHSLALSAPAGQVLAACEQHALGQGRQLLKGTLAKAAQARVDHAEQKGGPPAPAAAAARSASKGAAGEKS